MRPYVPGIGGDGSEGARPAARPLPRGRRGRAAAGVPVLWLSVIGVLYAWTWGTYRLFAEGHAVLGAVVGLVLPAAVTAAALLAWATRSEEGV